MVLNSHLPWPLSLLLLVPKSVCSVCRSVDGLHGIQSSGFPYCPLSVPLSSQSSTFHSLPCLLGLLFPLALPFFCFWILKYSGILVRCIAQWPATRICLLFFSLLHWDRRFEGEDHSSKMPFSQCLTGVVCAASTFHVVLTLNTCWVSPPNTLNKMNYKVKHVTSP